MLVKKMVMNLESHDTIRKQKITSGNLKSKKSNGFSQNFWTTGAFGSCCFLHQKLQVSPHQAPAAQHSTRVTPTTLTRAVVGSGADATTSSGSGDNFAPAMDKNAGGVNGGGVWVFFLKTCPTKLLTPLPMTIIVGIDAVSFWDFYCFCIISGEKTSLSMFFHHF